MNAKSVNDKRLADSEIEEGEITEAIEKIVKKRIVNKKTEDEDEKGIHQISASKNQSKKKKMKKSLIAEDSMKIDPKKEEPKHDESNDEEKLIINNSEEDNDDETSSKKKRKKKEPQTFAKMDIENYPEQQILLCSYNDCPMLVHISNVDIKLPNQFYITQRKVRTTGEKNTFREDPNVIEYSLDKGIKKYWEQRYFLFNKYDEGIKLDRESWYSATPESVAYYTANRLRGAKVILDAFCGAGGNTIQVSLRFNGLNSSSPHLLIRSSAMT